MTREEAWRRIKCYLYYCIIYGEELEQEQKTRHCKECKYFEYDSVAKVDGIPLIVAHEICSKWGDGCKTKEDGYCFLFEKKESEGKMIDCNGNDVTQEAKDFFDSLEEDLIEAKRQFESCDKCKQRFNKKIDKIRDEIREFSVVDESGTYRISTYLVDQIIDKYMGD